MLKYFIDKFVSHLKFTDDCDDIKAYFYSPSAAEHGVSL